MFFLKTRIPTTVVCYARPQRPVQCFQKEHIRFCVEEGNEDLDHAGDQAIDLAKKAGIKLK